MKKFIITTIIITFITSIVFFTNTTNAKEVEDTIVQTSIQPVTSSSIPIDCTTGVINEIGGCEPVGTNGCSDPSDDTCLSSGINGPATVVINNPQILNTGCHLTVGRAWLPLGEFEIPGDSTGTTSEFFPCGPLSSIVIPDTISVNQNQPDNFSIEINNSCNND
jgi:hypothetical protein